MHVEGGCGDFFNAVGTGQSKPGQTMFVLSMHPSMYTPASSISRYRQEAISVLTASAVSSECVPFITTSGSTNVSIPCDWEIKANRARSLILLSIANLVGRPCASSISIGDLHLVKQLPAHNIL